MTPEEIAKEAARRKSVGQAGNEESARKRLEKLSESGSLRPAEAAALEALRAKEQTNKDAIGQTGALYSGALQGLTYNWADEIRLQDKQKVKEAQAEYPSEFAAGRAAGGVTSGAALGLATAPFAAPGIAGNMLIGGGLGAAEGAAWEAGRASPGNRANAAARGALVGGGVGAAAPLAVGVAGRAVGAAADMAMGAANAGNKGRAYRAISEDLRKSGKTGGDVANEVDAARLQGQPEFRAMDALGVAGRRRASGIVRGGGPGSDELSDFLSQRQLDQGDRVSAFVDDAFGTQGTTAKKAQASMKDRRDKTADRMYSEARDTASPVDTRAAVSVIDKRIGGMDGSNIKGDGIDAKLAKFRSRLVADPAPDGEISRELSDFDRVLGVKQDVQDAIGAAIRAGRNNEARELGNLSRQLDRALEKSSDAYRFANDNFREASRVIDSVDRGSQMQTRGRAADNVSEISRMTPQQKAAARIGYGDAIQGKLERNSAVTSDKSKTLLSKKSQIEADALAIDPAILRQRLEREREMWRTQNKALGGSQTADNLADIQNSGIVGDAMRAGQDLTAGNAGTAISRMTDKALPLLTGQNQATRKLVADILASPDPRTALSTVMKTERNAQKRAFIYQSVVRGLSRGATPSQDKE